MIGSSLETEVILSVVWVYPCPRLMWCFPQQLAFFQCLAVHTHTHTLCLPMMWTAVFVYQLWQSLIPLVIPWSLVYSHETLALYFPIFLSCSNCILVMPYQGPIVKSLEHFLDCSWWNCLFNFHLGKEAFFFFCLFLVNNLLVQLLHYVLYPVFHTEGGVPWNLSPPPPPTSIFAGSTSFFFLTPPPPPD